MEIPKIGLKSAKDGNKDLKKGGKFRGALRPIQIKETQDINTSPQSIATGSKFNTSQQTKGFQKSITAHGFQFDIVDISKAGSRMQIDYLITNNTGDDKVVAFGPFYTSYYDDQGNFVNANEMCVLGVCGNKGPMNGEAAMFTRGTWYLSAFRYTNVPHGIPIKAKLIFNNIKNDATKLIRGGFMFGYSEKTGQGTETTFKISYNNIPIPSEVSSLNSKVRLSPNGETEIINVKNREGMAILNVNYKNTSQEPISLSPQSTTLYDESGNRYIARSVTFADEPQKYYLTVSTRKGYTVQAGQTVNYYIYAELNKNKPKEFKRVDIGFDGFTLSWTDIAIKGVNSSNTATKTGTENRSNGHNTGTNYMSFGEFESKSSTISEIVGKKIILEKIYFKSGSDDILSESHNQLDKMAELLKLNSTLHIEISGHTDDVGDDVSNMLLSQKRADAIRYYMIAKSINPQRVKSVGKGETEPISTNQSSIGRTENRRVEIQVVQ